MKSSIGFSDARDEIAARTISYRHRSMQLWPIVDVPAADGLNLRWMLDTENNAALMLTQNAARSMSDAHIASYANADNPALSRFIHASFA